MHFLFPGRHHLLTNFQYEYLQTLIDDAAASSEPVASIIFAVTSANHSETRRNPLPLYLRAMAIQEFSSSLSVPCYVYHIDDVGTMQDFAGYTIKRIASQSGNPLNLTAENTTLLCSTPSVIKMYRDLGFDILPVELIEESDQYRDSLPWQVVESVTGENPSLDLYQEKAHPATQSIWQRYQLIEKVRMLFTDRMIGDDGDLTETRDYNSYVRQMDENIDFKFRETEPFIQPGRIGDIGCAVGSWIKKSAEQGHLKESDFFGVEVSRQLFDICEHRKSQGEFSNPCVFFSRRNAVSGLVFPQESMDTIHTSSLTHEIFSYIDNENCTNDEQTAIAEGTSQLRKFIRNRFEELKEGGVWINRDVVGPEDGARQIHLVLTTTDGATEGPLEDLSTHGRFLQFVKDYRKEEGHRIEFKTIQQTGDQATVQICLQDAWEFATKKDYTDNWASEMHERFCFWSFSDWMDEMKSIGFTIHTDSNASANPWIVENRLEGKLSITETDGKPIEYPPTGMVLVARKTSTSNFLTSAEVTPTF